jgi:predicted GNAT superfamily acetyltransferase
VGDAHLSSTQQMASPGHHGLPQDDDFTIRDLATLEEYTECCEIQEETWGRGFSERVPAAILRVSQKIGGVTAGAFDGNGRMIGFVFGMTGIRDGRPAHWSDMLAVREEARGHHIGDRLKHYQRQQVLALGVELMLWTCDPLVSRNAHFNINRLGARPVEYIPNMYGDNTGSTLHGMLPTDRFVIGWPLTNDFVPSPHAGRPGAGDEELPLVNPLDADGLPLLSLPAAARAARVQIPREMSGVPNDPADARLRWRLTVRDALTALFARGARVTRFVRDVPPGALPYYVVE